MTETPFICNECHMDLNESNVRLHISAKHLDYFPYKCLTCKDVGIKHETVSAELMYEHTSTVHEGTEPEIRFSMTKENELKVAVENCRRLSAEQILLNDSKDALCQVFNLFNVTSTTNSSTTGNMVTSIQNTEERGEFEVPETDSSRGDDPNAKVNSQGNVKRNVSSHSNARKACRVRPKRTHFAKKNLKPVGPRLQAAKSSQIPMDANKHKFCSNASATKTSRVRNKRTDFAKKTFKCDDCSRVCFSESQLAIHVRTHTGEKPFKCNRCSYASTCAGNLKRHMLNHTREKPNKCT
ncbi:ikaros family zinc finger protein [Ditylenchus destructor]|nr:ikaros family zinc finger protein [Ditylenchus destructor]